MSTASGDKVVVVVAWPSGRWWVALVVALGSC